MHGITGLHEAHFRNRKRQGAKEHNPLQMQTRQRQAKVVIETVFNDHHI